MNRFYAFKALAVLLMYILAVFVFTVPAFGATKRVALVIGNSDYENVPLKNPVNDARDVSRMLKKFGFEVITKLNADQRNMDEAMDDLYKKLMQAELGLFYYAGHGMQIQGQNYLIPVQSTIKNASDVKYKAINAGRLLGKMQDAGAKTNIVILDACRNNPFRNFFRSSGQGLAFMDAPAGTLISYSTGLNSVAADGKGRNGLYTEYLLRNMAKENLSVLQLFNRTALDVKKITVGVQQPFIYFNGLEPIYLAGGNPEDNIVATDSGVSYKPTVEAGSLKVTSNPTGATVLVGGKSSGQTALQLGNLPLGGIDVSVSKDGYISEKRSVTIKKGRKSVVHFDLEKESTSGWLTINKNPSHATVRILNIGPSYQDGIELAPGRYHVEVSASGYKTEKRWIDLDVGEDLLIDFSLSRQSAVVAQPSPPSSSTSRSFTDPTTGMEFVRINDGCFQMGSPSSEKDRDEDEGPQHRVCVDSFYMAKHEVTLGQWRKFVKSSGYKSDAEKDRNNKGCYSLKGSNWGYHDGRYWDNPGFSQSASQPVSCVSHNDVQAFVTWLNRKSGKKYSLPTEAQWEYAARAGSTGSRFWGGGESDACRYANVYDQTAKNKYNFSWPHFKCNDGFAATAPVGSFQSNDFGLYDMLGNVWEWTSDWYGKDYYSKSPVNNPEGPGSGWNRVDRGGGWDGRPAFVRSAFRNRLIPWGRDSSLGFRLALQDQN